MQHDEVIWQVVNRGHCSYRAATKTQNFCRNAYNVTGLCNRSSCPLSNSRFATIREIEGNLYLYMKTIERSHTPKDLWERVKLPRNYGKALELVDKHLEFWPKFLVHKNKQRLTKLTQYLIRMRKMALKVKPKIVTIPAKQAQREARREAKAETAAAIDRSIEKELLQRLQGGTYGDIYNYPFKEYEKVLAMEEMDPGSEEEKESEAQVEYVEGLGIEDGDDFEDAYDIPYSSDSGLDEVPAFSGQVGSFEDVPSNKRKRSSEAQTIIGKHLTNGLNRTKATTRGRKSQVRTEIEYEEEREAPYISTS